MFAFLTVSCIVLLINKGKSGSSEVKSYKNWKAANYALMAVVAALDWVGEYVSALACPCDPFCISENICNTIKNLITGKIKWLFKIVQKVRLTPVVLIFFDKQILDANISSCEIHFLFFFSVGRSC